MDSTQFVNGIKVDVRDAAISDTLKNLEKPPGRRPSISLTAISGWYNQLGNEDREQLRAIVAHAVDSAIFGLRVVLDGDRVIEGSEDEGRFELRYIGQNDALLNHSTQMALHDIFNIAIGKSR